MSLEKVPHRLARQSVMLKQTSDGETTAPKCYDSATMAGDSAGLAIRVLNEWYLHIDPSKDEVIALRQLAETEEQQSMPLDQLAHLVLLREMAKSRASA